MIFNSPTPNTPTTPNTPNTPLNPMRKITIILSLLPILLWAAPKTNHYSALEGKSGVQLFNAIKQCAEQGYTQLDYDELEKYMCIVDSKNGQIIDVYTDCLFDCDDANGGNSKICDSWNKEHSIPKSWWGSENKETRQGCDLFHLLPTDSRANNIRSNHPYGEVTGSYTACGTSKFGYNAAGIQCFEPTPQYKGDLARGYFGTLVRWMLAANKSTEGAVMFNGTFTADANFGLTTYSVNLLLNWHRQDPVSEKELARNDSIESTQGNRNPFIDYPELAEYLWGNKKGQTVSLQNLTSPYTDYQPANPEQPQEQDKTNGNYYRVKNDLSDWTGTYLIVFEDDDNYEYYALNGAQITTASKNGPQKAITISQDQINASATIDPCAITIEKCGSGWALKTTNNLYIGNPDGGNNLKAQTTPLPHNISCSANSVDIVHNNTYLRFNTQASQKIFRYYKQNTQQPISLFKKEENTTTQLQNYINPESIVQVFDIMGRKYPNMTIKQLKHNLPKGIYIIKYNQISQKIIVQ
ncbi:MAG: endonuclease [Paludibacteraceae bacterium]|nr:endonuclease [Paludibacteraceae bacterium]